MSARFDFHGNIVNTSTDEETEEVSMTTALHHHGEEPHLAGYTLEELYTLVRSLNISQKVLALATMANIIRKVTVRLQLSTEYYDQRVLTL